MEDLTSLKRFVEQQLLLIYTRIGCDRPRTHDIIVDFIVEDMQGAADPIHYHSGDVSIAFRRFLERDYET
jgi:hypothetical protein